MTSRRTYTYGGEGSPIHLSIEAENTKGKYASYDAFLGLEADGYLRLDLEQRCKGSPDERNPPEELSKDSPPIRDENSRTPKPMGSEQIGKMIRNLYQKAMLLNAPRGRMYDLRVHSLCKYFTTQLNARGIKEPVIDSMMGHVNDTHADIQSLGVELLRNVYASACLCIRPSPKPEPNKIEAIKTMIRALGENPEAYLSREALSQPAQPPQQRRTREPAATDPQQDAARTHPQRSKYSIATA